MPLDKTSRQYADKLFQEQLESIIKNQGRELANVRREYAGRNTTPSGGSFNAQTTALVRNAELLVQARTDSLLRAYEKSGAVLDDVGILEITSEVKRFCDQHGQIISSNLRDQIGRAFGGQPPGGFTEAIAGRAHREVNSISARVARRLSIMRDEAVLAARNLPAGQAAPPNAPTPSTNTKANHGDAPPPSFKPSAGATSASTMPIFTTALEVYRALETIGAGGAGVVYKVETEERQVFAVKCLDSAKATTGKRKRFKTELYFCAKNEHKNIITVLDHGVASINGKDSPFYVMPYYATTLREQMKAGISHEKILRLFSQILDGVEAAHLKKVWHRDIKPENILCDESNDLLVVADFGIAHFEQDELYTLIETNARDRLANFQYAAPEQRTRGMHVDHRADIYALGVILNEMFTNHILQGTGYKKISQIAAEYSYLDEIVDRMVQQSAENRPSILDIKQILIAKENEFISLQKLDQLKATVIDSATIEGVLEVNVVDVDIRENSIVMVLSCSPPPEWKRLFVRPNSLAWTGVTSPQNWLFNGAEAIAKVRPNIVEIQAQAIVNNFKLYVEKANELYRQQVEQIARVKEEEQRRALQKTIAEEERRHRIRKNLKV